MVHFERGTKQRYHLGPIDHQLVEEGLGLFHKMAAILQAALAGRQWLVGDRVSYADFRMATFLPFNDVGRLPLGDYPVLAGWYRRLEGIEAWRDPFNGLDAPELPPVQPG
jgi:glutathione S-transferase